MKISLYVPIEANLDEQRNFIRSEIAQARSIKSKQTRKSVLAGLNKLLNALNEGGIALFTDGDELIIERYNGVKRLYRCGHDYEIVKEPEYYPNFLVVMDASSCAIGVSDGERVKVLWCKDSLVPRKHRAGGQSQRRFERDRDRALLEWLRMIVEQIVALYKDDSMNIIVGGAGMTKDALITEMPQWLRAKIVSVRSVGYTDENGLWELMKISRYESNEQT